MRKEKEVKLSCPCGAFFYVKAQDKDKPHTCPVCGVKINAPNLIF